MEILIFRAPELARWEARAFNVTAGDTGKHRDNHERDVAREPPGAPVAGGPHRKAAEAILRYDIFPPSTIRPVIRRAPIVVGDTVGALYVGFRVVKILFASRVIDAFDGERDGWWHTGFTYRTLAHHPELGEETFSVEKELATGRVRVALRSWSRPGTLLARTFAPLLRGIQLRAGRAALGHLEAISAA